jgi:hypothetical protein
MHPYGNGRPVMKGTGAFLPSGYRSMGFCICGVALVCLLLLGWPAAAQQPDLGWLALPRQGVHLDCQA